MYGKKMQERNILAANILAPIFFSTACLTK